MKLFDVNWSDVLHGLPMWSALPLAARPVLLTDIRMSGYFMPAALGAHRDAIVESGLVRMDDVRHRLSLPDEHRALVKVMRAAYRHPLFDNPSIPFLVGYLEEHFTQVEVDAFGGRTTSSYKGYINRSELASRVAYAAWPGDLLMADSDKALQRWAAARGASPEAGVTVPRLRRLRTLVDALRHRAEGTPMRDLGTLGDLGVQVDPRFLGETIHLGLSLLVLFVGMRRRDLEPMIGLWPEAVHELTRPPAEPPTVVEPSETFTLAMRMEDMSAVLSAVVAAPIRVRANDLSVFARTQATISALMVEIPTWAVPGLVLAPYSRVDIAANALMQRGFIELQSVKQQPHITRTDDGVAWLAGSAQQRLRALVAPLRDLSEVNPPGGYDIRDSEGFFPFVLPYFHVPKELRLREAITRAFLSLPDGFVALQPFLEHASRSENPFIALPADAMSVMQRTLGFAGGEPRAEFVSIWSRCLFHFFVARLAVHGGVRLGHHGDDLAFVLTDVGRFLLGAADEFAYGATDSGDVVVQPNFDVVFLGVAPSIEASLARVADRVGRAPGLVFRLTRDSVLRAAESGMSADDVLGTLRAASTKGLPKNVQREVEGWLASVRRATLRTLEVIECDSVAAGDTVAALLGAKVSRISPTHFELPKMAVSARNTLLKKLRANGVLLDVRSGEAHVQRRGRR